MAIINQLKKTGMTVNEFSWYRLKQSCWAPFVFALLVTGFAALIRLSFKSLTPLPKPTRMNFGVQFRIVTLGLVSGLMAALIVITILISQRQVSELRARLNSVSSESSEIMDQFEESLGKLNGAILRYGTDHDPELWQKSDTASDQLSAWLGKQKTVLQTPNEKALLQQIQAAYVDYLKAISDFHLKVELLNGRSASLTDFTPVRNQSQRLFALGQALARAHYQSHNELLQHANQLLEHLHFLVLILLALLCVFGIAMAIAVYRHLIAPLRVKLVDTQGFAIQHERLAFFGLLAADMAHEMRYPLRSIKIGTGFQKSRFPSGTSERADAEVVELEIERLEKILDDFLEFFKSAAPKLAIVKLKPFLNELRHFLIPQLRVNNIQLVTEILVPIQVRADAAQLKQVINILVQNAANSIGHSGRITLRVRLDRRLLAGSEADVAILEVTDSGKGILPEVEKHAFDPFLTAKKNGTGLGLSIAAQIIQKHGGQLQYQKRVNHGTTFGIILPQMIE